MPLEAGRRYDESSPALRRLNAAVDDWPAPPAGLFVVEERTVYLKSRSPMTVAHEFGHALDCALGNGLYYSSFDAKLKTLFANAREFVTPYASTAIDEYFIVIWNGGVSVLPEKRSRWHAICSATLG